jgi:hypothetical protein
VTKNHKEEAVPESNPNVQMSGDNLDEDTNSYNLEVVSLLSIISR